MKNHIIFRITLFINVFCLIFFSKNLIAFDGLLITPDEYYLTIYECGFLRSAPNTPSKSTSLDLHDRVKIYDEHYGKQVTIRKGVSSNIPGSLIYPPAGEYTHQYVIVEPVFKLKAKYTVNQITYYTTNSNYYNCGSNIETDSPSTTDVKDYGVVTMNMNGLYNHASEKFDGSDVLSFLGKSVQCYLLDSNWKIFDAVENQPAPSNSRVIVIIPSPVSVNSKSKFDIKFNITDSGWALNNNNGKTVANDGVTSFSVWSATFALDVK